MADEHGDTIDKLYKSCIIGRSNHFKVQSLSFSMFTICLIELVLEDF